MKNNCITILHYLIKIIAAVVALIYSTNVWKNSTEKKFQIKFHFLETLYIFAAVIIKYFYMSFFETIFLEEADMFVASLNAKTQQKIFCNIRIAEKTNDSELFKKLNYCWCVNF